uniref:C2H2-type domain-containing protein n=1 Tax=Arion vulgaris TaxID=1028688 RepID=A0A0B7B232_9EUPU
MVTQRAPEFGYQHLRALNPRRAGFAPRRQFKNISGVHTGSPSGRLYTCDICGSSFTKSFNLTRHRGKCAGTRVYYCHVCQKPFYRTDKLRIHLATKHPTSFGGLL